MLHISGCVCEHTHRRNPSHSPFTSVSNQSSQPGTSVVSNVFSAYPSYSVNSGLYFQSAYNWRLLKLVQSTFGSNLAIRSKNSSRVTELIISVHQACCFPVAFVCDRPSLFRLHSGSGRARDPPTQFPLY